MAWTETIPMKVWLPLSIGFLICAILSVNKLKKEISIRFGSSSSKEVKFTTKSLEYLSLISLITGTLRFIFGLFEYINGLCTFSAYIAVICWSLQTVSMGYYQLSRLHYCFANKQIHSNKGYPKYIFIIMFLLGLIHVFNYPLQAGLSGDVGGDFFENCTYKYNSDLNQIQFVRISLDIWSVTAHQDLVWFQFSIILFIAWDLLTLILYIYKTSSLKSEIDDPNITKRIKNILNKIIILTILYQIFFFIGLCLSFCRKYWIWFGLIGWSFSNIISSYAMIISMFLMMDHNVNHYVHFLKMIKRYCSCCRCCIGVIEDQLSACGVGNGEDVGPVEVEMETTNDVTTLNDESMNTATIAMGRNGTSSVANTVTEDVSKFL